jgi:hypothetical protein
MGNRSRLLTATVTLALIGATVLAAPSTAAAPDPSKGTVSVNAPAAALVGDPIVFRGRLSLKRSGLKVGLQRKVGSGWKNVDQTRTTTGGRYQLSSSVDLGGVYKFRVIRLPWLTTSAKSRVVTVGAYAWNNVSSMLLQHGEFTGLTVSDGPLHIDGTTYPNSIGIDADSQGDPDGGYFSVNLAGLGCAAFDATLGGQDDSDAGSVVGAKVRVDGTQVAGGNYGPDDSERVTLDVRGADVLRVEGLVVNPGPYGDLGVGTPRLLCAS